MSNFQNVSTNIATSALGNVTNGGKKATWFESLATAWGKAMNDQASQVESLAQQISDGDDKPATITALSAESLKMQFLANSQSTSLNSVGSALETMARKQ